MTNDQHESWQRVREGSRPTPSWNGDTVKLTLVHKDGEPFWMHHVQVKRPLRDTIARLLRGSRRVYRKGP